MPNLDEAHLVFSGAQRFHDSIDAVTRQAKDGINTPVDDIFNQDIGGRFRHLFGSNFLGHVAGHFKMFLDYR